MKTVKIAETNYIQAVIPEIPDFIALSNGTQFLIKDYATEQLQAIGEAWTAELIQTAQARRGAPRRK